MPDFDVRIEEVHAGHLTQYAELSRAEYGDSPISDLTHLHWKFLENPQGPSKAVHVLSGDCLVARIVAQPRQFRTPAGMMTAAYMVDMVVHPKHRGMPLLLALLNGFKQLHDQFSFVLVTPNEAGFAVWKHFVKLPERFVLDVKAVPLRPAILARRLWPWVPHSAASFADFASRALIRATMSGAGRATNLRLEHAWPADRDLDLLLASPPGTVVGVRDRSFITWRFKRSPVFKYEVDFIYKDDRLAGYFATRRAVFRGYDTRFIIDVYGSAQLTRRDWSTVTWRTVRHELQLGGADILLILGNAAAGQLSHISRFPFVAVPERYLPQKAALFADWWSLPAFDFTRATLELTLADCDML